ncbi:MAG: type II toxin-antitoxin system ParD family antitoxin [Magnetococcales bacterium]|nr:type II toxin-antitoxin system ParD family antitoxin [Magnetococcales bacterium]
MSTNVSLTPELEIFAHSCVESGRFSNVGEVVCSALRLLRDQEKRREDFTAMLLAAQEEADREGVFTIDQVLSEMDEIIDSASQ